MTIKQGQKNGIQLSQLTCDYFSALRLSNGMPTVAIIAVARIIMTARLM